MIIKGTGSGAPGFKMLDFRVVGTIIDNPTGVLHVSLVQAVWSYWTARWHHNTECSSSLRDGADDHRVERYARHGAGFLFDHEVMCKRASMFSGQSLLCSRWPVWRTADQTLGPAPRPRSVGLLGPRGFLRMALYNMLSGPSTLVAAGMPETCGASQRRPPTV